MDLNITKRKTPLTDDITHLAKDLSAKLESTVRNPSSTFKVPDTRFDDEVMVLQGQGSTLR